MNIQTKAILCNTDSELHKDSENHESSSTESNPIPRVENKTYVSTFSENIISSPKNEEYSKSESIDTIVRNLDNNVIECDNMEYVTKSKFSTLISEMRVDILSLVNLLAVLNKTLTSTNEEIDNMKKDICKLVSENTYLKENLSKQREDIEKINNFDSHDHSNADNVSFREPEFYQNIKVVKKNTPINTQIIRKSSNDNTFAIDEANLRDEAIRREDEAIDNKPNVLIDSFMEKRSSKFKHVPIKKRTDIDAYGSKVEENDEQIFNNNSRQILRRENYDNALKTKDTKQTRPIRLGLSNNIVDKMSINRM